MKRKKKPNRLLISGLISALAALAIVAVAPGFAGPSDISTTSQSKDNDGDHDNDPNTALEDDHTTADAGDNRHPSGKDRSVENGKSGNQGRSESNPDDTKGPMRYEGGQGDDKPNGPGGADVDDQDGNNGCGNDDDFDDDNNGWCGKPSRTKKSPPSNDDDEVRGNNEVCPDKADMTQGRSCSEPDDDGRGPDRNESGRDKDEDGNNGCGNDDDRVDDSEGWCGKPEVEDDEVAPVRLCPDGSVMPAGGNCGEGVPCPDGTTMDDTGNCLEDEVLGEQLERAENPAQPEVGAAEEGPSVLGIRLSPTLDKPVKVAGAVLPFTGGDVLLFLMLALALFCSGLVIMKKTPIGSSQG